MVEEEKIEEIKEFEITKNINIMSTCNLPIRFIGNMNESWWSQKDLISFYTHYKSTHLFVMTCTIELPEKQWSYVFSNFKNFGFIESDFKFYTEKRKLIVVSICTCELQFIEKMGIKILEIHSLVMYAPGMLSNENIKITFVKYGYVYQIKNLVNGKKYIGQTFNKKRHRDFPNGYRKNNHLCTSYKKYGIENFEITEINKTKNQNILNKLEEFYIQKFNTLNPDFGYNKKHVAKKKKKKLTIEQIGDKGHFSYIPRNKSINRDDKIQITYNERCIIKSQYFDFSHFCALVRMCSFKNIFLDVIDYNIFDYYIYL